MEKRHNPEEISRFNSFLKWQVCSRFIRDAAENNLRNVTPCSVSTSWLGAYIISCDVPYFKQFLLLLCKGFFQQTATTRIRYKKG
jgi:hypothetical protein